MDNNDEVYNILNKYKNESQLEYALYEYFMSMEYSDPRLQDAIKELNKRNLKKIIKTLYMVPVIQVYKSVSDMEKLNKFMNIKDTSKVEEIYNGAIKSYDRIIKATNALGNELGTKNSLEMSILFSYLLYGGYYSITGNHEYQIEGRNMVPGLFAHEIFKGKGVCLNYSAMLSDVLNDRGIKASFLANKANDSKEIEYRIPIERGYIKPTLLTKFKMAMLNPLTASMGNHAVTLIIEDENPYIFDSTNLLLFECTSNKEAIGILNGCSLDLKPYLTSMFTNNNEIEAIKSLSMTNDYVSPYSGSDLISTSEYCLDMYDSIKPLFTDFHESILDDASNIVSSCKILTKK